MSALARHVKSLNAAVAVGDGKVVDTLGAKGVTMVTVASGVTTGGTVLLQGSADGGSTWYTIATRAVSANGAFLDTTADTHRLVRARLSARTDGTYSVYLLTSGYHPGGWDTS